MGQIASFTAEGTREDGMTSPLQNAPKTPVYPDKGGWDDVMYHGGRFDPAYDSWSAEKQRSYEFGREFAATVRKQIGECPFPETVDDRKVMIATMMAAHDRKILELRAARGFV